MLVALLAFTPASGQYSSAHRELDKLARQQSIQDELVALVQNGSINLRCGPVGVPNHAPVPLLALYLKTSPANVVSAQSGTIESGQYVDPASKEVEEDYVLDPHDPHRPVNVPPGFLAAHANRSWLIFQRCVITAALDTKRTVHPASRHRLPVACRRPRLRSGNARCACRGSLKAASFRT